MHVMYDRQTVLPLLAVLPLLPVLPLLTVLSLLTFMEINLMLIFYFTVKQKSNFFM